MDIKHFLIVRSDLIWLIYVFLLNLFIEDILLFMQSFANCSVIVSGSNERVEMEVEEYRVLPFVWAAARLTQHRQTGALGHQSRNGDR